MTKKAFRTRCKALRLRAQGGGTARGERHAAKAQGSGLRAQGLAVSSNAAHRL